MKQKRFIVALLLMIVFSALLLEDNRVGEEAVDTDANDISEYQDSVTTGQNQATQVISVKYRQNGISAEYPKIVNGGSEKELNQWNQIIEGDFDKILDIYSFQPFPQLTPIPADQIPVILTIKYDMKLNSEKYISILYTAAYNSPYSAHPTQLIYTTNISKSKSSRLKLKDMVKLNNNFVENFRTWNLTTIEEGNEELYQAVQDYVAGISNSDLLLGFEAADIIGSKNLLDVYTYLTQESLGISLGVPHYAGDHAEFEKNYTELQDFIRSGF
jgi:hypothetical protein